MTTSHVLRMAGVTVLLTALAASQNPPLTWTQGVPLPSGRSDAQAAMDLQGRIYVLGGNDTNIPPYSTDTCFRFDEPTGTWTQIQSMSIRRSNYGIASDYLGRIYAIGGFTDTPVPFTSHCERFNGLQWEPVQPLPQATGYVRAVASPDGTRIFAFGGQLVSGATNAIYRYEVADNWWYQEPSAIYAHALHGLAITGSGVLYATGINGSVVHLQRRDPCTGLWTDLGPTPLPDQIGACVADQFDNIFFLGGYAPGAVASVWRYASRTATWIRDTDLPSPTANMAGVISQSAKLYLIGGDPGTGAVRLTTVHCAQLSSQPGAAFVTFGEGCAGSAGTPRLSSGTTPLLGQAFTMQVSQLPLLSFAVGVIGPSAQTPPLALGFVGMPGCSLYVVLLDGVVLVGVGTGQVSWTLNIPSDPTLAGVRLYTQAIVADPNVNALGFSASNAARLTIGY